MKCTVEFQMGMIMNRKSVFFRISDWIQQLIYTNAYYRFFGRLFFLLPLSESVPKVSLNCCFWC